MGVDMGPAIWWWTFRKGGLGAFGHCVDHMVSLNIVSLTKLRTCVLKTEILYSIFLKVDRFKSKF